MDGKVVGRLFQSGTAGIFCCTGRDHLGIWIFFPIYFVHVKRPDGARMRISLHDSLTNGFKRWSDAQGITVGITVTLASPAAVPSDAVQSLARRLSAMTQGERENDERRTIEALAQSLYETEDPGGVAWAKRTRIVREPWILRARQQLKAAQGPSAGGGTRGESRSQ